MRRAPPTATHAVPTASRQSSSTSTSAAAFDTALRLRKPVYLEIPGNLAGATTSLPGQRTRRLTPDSAASIAAAEFLNAAVKPASVGGVGLCTGQAEAGSAELAGAAGCTVATIPNAKSFLPEDHPGYIGTYWRPVSSPGRSEIV